MKPAPPVTSTAEVMARKLEHPGAAACCRPVRSPAVRVLIFTADIGEGHDLPARMLRDGILERHPGAEVRIVDALEAAGPLAQATVRNGAETILEHLRPLFDLQYWLVSRWRPSRAVAGLLAMALSARGLRRTIAAWRPDVVVSTYPGATEVLGRL